MAIDGADTEPSRRRLKPENVKLFIITLSDRILSSPFGKVQIAPPETMGLFPDKRDNYGGLVAKNVTMLRNMCVFDFLHNANEKL